MEQLTSSNVEMLLQDLQSGGLVSTRRDAALAFGKLAESSEPIAIALLVAKESDDNLEVRNAATEALLASAHQTFIEQHPELVTKATESTQVRQAQRAQATKIAASTNAGKSDVKSWGIYLLIAGIAALMLPLFGYQLLLFRFISTENPMCGLGLIVIGIMLIVAGSR